MVSWSNIILLVTLLNIWGNAQANKPCEEFDFMETATELIDSGVDHWNKGNTTGVVEQYADDGVLISNGLAALTKPEIRVVVEAMIRTFPRIESTAIEAIGMSPTRAYSIQVTDMYRTDGQPSQFIVREFVLWELIGENWKTSRVMTNGLSRDNVTNIWDMV